MLDVYMGDVTLTPTRSPFDNINEYMEVIGALRDDKNTFYPEDKEHFGNNVDLSSQRREEADGKP